MLNAGDGHAACRVLACLGAVWVARYGCCVHAGLDAVPDADRERGHVARLGGLVGYPAQSDDAVYAGGGKESRPRETNPVGSVARVRSDVGCANPNRHASCGERRDAVANAKAASCAANSRNGAGSRYDSNRHRDAAASGKPW